MAVVISPLGSVLLRRTAVRAKESFLNTNMSLLLSLASKSSSTRTCHCHLAQPQRALQYKHVIVTQPPRAGSRTSLDGAEEEDAIGDLKPEVRPHKYVIQAMVLRESWPLTQHQWVFVQELKEKEKEELKGTQTSRLQVDCCHFLWAYYS